MRKLHILLVGIVFLAGSLGGCDDKSAAEKSEKTGTKKQQQKKQKQKKQQNDDKESTESSESTNSKKDKKEMTDIENEALLNPSAADEEAPSTFKVQFSTTEGAFTAEFHRDWAPNGVDRLYNLVKIGYFEDIAFFRVIEGFMAQFGLHGNPKVNKAWKGATIEDDPVEKSNKRGYVTFAQRRAPDTRNTQLFINYQDNSNLDKQGFAPIGKVVEGMDVVDSIHAGYGEGAPRGDGPSQQKIKKKGNKFLKKEFPKLDYIESVEIISE
jgi:peptidyl-prolyl cis-trans isomerase A (cyclophilin A)